MGTMYLFFKLYVIMFFILEQSDSYPEYLAGTKRKTSKTKQTTSTIEASWITAVSVLLKDTHVASKGS